MSEPVRVAVASRDGKTVSGHIGKCADWIVFEADNGGKVREAERITLSKQLIFHHYKDDTPHPLRDCVTIIGASAGDSFITKMQARGMQVELTAEPDPATAVTDYLHKSLVPPKARPIGGLICKLRDMIS